MPTITAAGAIPIPPTTLLADEIAAATALSPELTANLPGSLVEDMASTATGAMVVIDQAVTDLINSISPYLANDALLYQLGAVYGVEQGIGANTSVYVTFISPSVNFAINPGFVVSDGTYQYVVQNGGVINTSGQSSPLFCISTTSGQFAVPAGTVSQLISSVPSGITLSCINLNSGIPGLPAQPISDYRIQVIQAGKATAQGVPTFLKTQLENVNGVVSRLISFRQVGTKWQVICGGGDPYEVAYAILNSVPDIGNLTGSLLTLNSITNAYPAVVVTNLNHGYETGQAIQIFNAIGMSGINSVPLIAVVISNNTLSLATPISSIVWSASVVTVTTVQPHGLPSGTTTGTIYEMTPVAYNGTYSFTNTGTNTFTYPLASNPGVSTTLGFTGFGTITNGIYVANTGELSPNVRNVVVSINDYPDTYLIPIVIPPAQLVTVDLTWDTISTNYVSPVAVANVGSPALATYINTLPVGQPINIFDMQIAFQTAVASILSAPLISQMLFTVTINGVPSTPIVGTGIIYGDPESFFETTVASIRIVQG